MPCFRLAARSAALLLVPALAIAQEPPVRAFTGLTLIDGTTRAPVPNATIVVRDGRVVAAGPGGSVKIPVGARVVSLTGKTVIPGIINAAWTKIHEPGTYRGQCAELCGQDHAFMPIVVVVKSKADFATWLAQQQAAGAAPATPAAPAATAAAAAAPVADKQG